MENALSARQNGQLWTTGVWRPGRPCQYAGIGVVDIKLIAVGREHVIRVVPRYVVEVCARDEYRRDRTNLVSVRILRVQSLLQA